eukprot:1328132-Amphidinium_carterae.1
MEVDDNAPRPPPKGAKPGRWSSNGEWIESSMPMFLSAVVIPPPPPPPPPLPPSSLREKELMKTMSTEDRHDYAKLVGLEHLTEEEPIPEWAKTFKAPPAPVVSEPLKPLCTFCRHLSIAQKSWFMIYLSWCIPLKSPSKMLHISRLQRSPAIVCTLTR